MRALGALLPIVVVAALAIGIRGHTEVLITLTNGNESTISWPQGSTVTYRINNQSSTVPNITSGSAPTLAIDTAFAQAGAATGLTFVNGGATGTASVGSDGINLITFANTPSNLAAVGGAVAVAITTFSTTTGTISESDIVFNPAMTFATTGAATAQDIESVAAHEIGHLCGQEHSPVCNATMFPANGSGNTLNRTLSDDDLAGLRSLYPPTASTDGNVMGSVHRSSSMPVYGAHVVLQEATTGRAITAGVTLPNGSFHITAVPPGVYTIYAEPLDGPFQAGSLSGSVWNPAAYDTTFRPAFFGGVANPTVLAVKAGTTTNAGVLTVAGPAPTLDITTTALTSSPTSFAGFGALAVSATPGFNQFMVLGGPGVGATPDSAFSFEGPFISITGPSTLAGTAGGTPFKVFPILVANNAPSGGYTPRITHNGQTAVMTGALDIRPGPSPQAYAQPYLTSPCPGSLGPLSLSANGQPSLGNATFTMTVTNTVGGNTGYLFLSLVADAATIFAGCVAAIDLNSLLIPFPGLPYALTNGNTTIPTPVPNDPALQGLTVYCQFAAEDVGAPQLFLGISNGLAVHIE